MRNSVRLYRSSCQTFRDIYFYVNLLLRSSYSVGYLFISRFIFLNSFLKFLELFYIFSMPFVSVKIRMQGNSNHSLIPTLLSLCLPLSIIRIYTFLHMLVLAFKGKFEPTDRVELCLTFLKLMLYPIVSDYSTVSLP